VFCILSWLGLYWLLLIQSFGMLCLHISLVRCPYFHRHYLALTHKLVDAYPTCAGPAISAFFIPSFLVAAGFAHIELLMLHHMSNRIFFYVLAGASFGVVILMYSIYFFGRAMRNKSKNANPHCQSRETTAYQANDISLEASLVATAPI